MKEQPAKPRLDRSIRSRRWRVSLRFILAATFGTLVGVAVAAVLFVSVAANFKNTFSLLNDQAISVINSMERAIRAETGRTENAVAAAAQMAARGNGAGDAIALEAILRAEPALDGLAIVRNGQVSVLIRDSGGRISAADVGRAAQFAAEIRTGRALSPASLRNGWLEPRQIGPDLFHFYTSAFAEAAGGDGVAAAIVGRNTINRIIGELGGIEGGTAFVLSGDAVIAHSRMPDSFRTLDAIPIAEFPDPALQEFVRAPRADEFVKAARQGIEVYNPAEDGHYVYLVKDLPDLSPYRYRIGAYLPVADVGTELRRAVLSLGVGVLGLVLAVIAAILLGKRISKPMHRIAAAAEKLAAFEIDTIEPLRRSRIAEIDQQAIALNRTRFAMQEFARYVPRKLVERLVRHGALETRSESRRVTVMFTDIVGFTGLSERMDASQTADLLNSHFGEICKIIVDHEGTVDKFMGDGVMAFWGAPDDDARHAAHAVAAAAAIQKAIGRANLLRRREGLAPVRLRIGMHSGEAIVGNIGGGGRQNYTMVGDAVNVAQRLEQLGKDIMRPGDETIALASDDLVQELEGEANFVPAGTRILRGRERPVAIWMLAEGAADKKVVEFPGAQSA